MSRAVITVNTATAERLRGVQAYLGWAEGKRLTVAEQLNYLLDHWQATDPLGRRYTAARAAAGAPPDA